MDLLCILNGPSLKQIYPIGSKRSVDYQKNAAESFGDVGMTICRFAAKLSVYSAPIFLFYYRKSNIIDYLPLLKNVVALWSLVYTAGVVVRFLGRYANTDYVNFANQFSSAVSRKDISQVEKLLAGYDFDLKGIPTTFHYSDITTKEWKPRQYLPIYRHNQSWALALPCNVIRYILANTIGIRILYPGTIIGSFIDVPLMKGRSFLTLEYNGKRAKIETKDKNYIDTMFIDNRGRSTNGDTLVLCCEGNAGFYEIGIMTTPLECGYSVLGWNHPGFGGSTGKPHPPQELNAVDAVMQYALSLGFSPQEVIVYAWSIGGFSSSWLVMNYPEINSIIVDASFDDVVHLATAVMPKPLSSLVVGTVKSYLNLNNAEQLKLYPGPVRFIRRTRDEVICSRPGDLATNRGNDLALKVLVYRYPYVFKDDGLIAAKNWLELDKTKKEDFVKQFGDLEECRHLFLKEGTAIPSQIGEKLDTRERVKLSLFLLSNHITDFDSTHCVPLPSRLFVLPWDVRDVAKSI
ncbi:phosphatidylserine lipase ABHD16A-like [Artemia franciscana]|uniref:Uncharacterized protein n=1 Tax=Artemia franciscana TaxID=6661 RepID=A0AA88HTU2_ARTSF|nr:hypothetical protein QYM36_012036 [Artemia franciscana]KAK2710723.1 hypothetical protein QYM36_012036 [Artemia franciscana]KAK2710724.1 hypothetical protein QYM36_012036 [Artemia franciscana]